MIRKEGNRFILENTFLKREIEIGNFGVRSLSFRNMKTGGEYLNTPCREFTFSLNRHYVNSIQQAQYQAVDGTMLKADHALEYVGYALPDVGNGREELCLIFRTDEVEVTVHYRIYHRIAGMRKWLTFIAHESDVLLENVVFDDTLLTPGGVPSGCDFYQGSQFTPAPVSFTLEGTADLVCCYNEKLEEGVLTATTAPGPLRYLMCYPDWNNLMNACSMSNAPFAKYLKNGEIFDTPASLIAFGNGKISSGKFSEEMRKLIRVGLPEFQGREQVMFCTWPGYDLNVSEKLMLNLADCAAELGIGCLVLDIGWFPWNYGKNIRGREPDPERFPHGMEAVSRYLHEKGIRFGLWVNIGNDHGDPQPDGRFDTLLSDGTPKRLGWNYSKAFHAKCFASGYREE
ncbi:MAG: alpha-galactosidase, partial [Lentisphaeria bacterium]|nr:alpha-galactosidase [Lentisphaeria bacterium]